MENSTQSTKCRTFKATGSFSRGKRGKAWNKVVKKKTKVRKNQNKNAQKLVIRNHPTHIKVDRRRQNEYDDDN